MNTGFVPRRKTVWMAVLAAILVDGTLLACWLAVQTASQLRRELIGARSEA